MQSNLGSGDYAAWCYFQCIDSKENNNFVEDFRQKFGRHRVTGDPIETSYLSVHLFAKSAEKAGTFDITSLRQAARGLVFSAPEGSVRLDPDNFHLHRFAHVGKLAEDGKFEIVWSSKTAIKPDPFPGYKSEQEWKEFLDSLYQGWDQSWERQ